MQNKGREFCSQDVGAHLLIGVVTGTIKTDCLLQSSSKHVIKNSNCQQTFKVLRLHCNCVAIFATFSLKDKEIKEELPYLI